MYGINLLIKEHDNILLFTDYVNKLCCDIVKGKEIAVSDFRECIEFGRNYADKQHHGKEEKILFQILLEKYGAIAEKLIRNGMLVEHDLGRYHLGELEKSLNALEEKETEQIKVDIITHACGYADLLRRHIAKENEVCFTFAERIMTQEDKTEVDNRSKQFEEESAAQGIQDKYLSWLHKKVFH